MELHILLLVGILMTSGYLFGKLFVRLGLTGILGYLLAGFILGPLLKLSGPPAFGEVITSFTLSLVGYAIGLSFSINFLKEMGKKMLTILVSEVIVTALCVFLFILLLTKNLPLSIMLGSLSCATAPAGTIAVLGGAQ